MGAGRSWTAWMISVLSIPRRYADVIPRSACPSWRCMTSSGIPSWRHLDGVGVPELVRVRTGDEPRRPARCDAAGHGSPAASMAARGSGRAERRTARRPAGSGAARARGRAAPTPSGPSRPPAGGRPSGADQHGAALAVKIGLGQRERFADPQPGTPEHDDQAAQPDRLGSVSRGSHHGDDLLHGWRVRRIAKTLVAGHAALVKAGQGRRRPAAPGTIQQSYGFHDVLLWTTVEPHDPPAPRRPRAYGRLAPLLHGTDCALTRPHRVVAEAVAGGMPPEGRRDRRTARPPTCEDRSPR